MTNSQASVISAFSTSSGGCEEMWFHMPESRAGAGEEPTRRIEKDALTTPPGAAAGRTRRKSARAASSALPVVHYSRQRCSPARARPATIPGALQTSRDAGPDASNPVLAAFRVRELLLAKVAEK